MNTLKFRKLDPAAIEPTYGTPGRWVSLADAIAHVRNLERGAVKCE